nr:hypothetical protein [Lysobacter enzymogenes]
MLARRYLAGGADRAGAWKRHALAAMALSAQADAQVPEALLAPLQAQMLDALLARLADALADGSPGVRAGFERALPGDNLASPPAACACASAPRATRSCSTCIAPPNWPGRGR